MTSGELDLSPLPGGHRQTESCGPAHPTVRAKVCDLGRRRQLAQTRIASSFDRPPDKGNEDQGLGSLASATCRERVRSWTVGGRPLRVDCRHYSAPADWSYRVTPVFSATRRRARVPSCSDATRPHADSSPIACPLRREPSDSTWRFRFPDREPPRASGRTQWSRKQLDS